MMYVPGSVVIFLSHAVQSPRQYCCVCGTWNTSSCRGWSLYAIAGQTRAYGLAMVHTQVPRTRARSGKVCCGPWNQCLTMTISGTVLETYAITVESVTPHSGTSHPDPCMLPGQHYYRLAERDSMLLKRFHIQALQVYAEPGCDVIAK